MALSTLKYARTLQGLQNEPWFFSNSFTIQKGCCSLKIDTTDHNSGRIKF
ncbi:predicted protein [Sclerotinia sclerotiorum 1980 UF-70]|uniref:Uncharacterized protein n=1 Tax=Sclerotinia sclerotiorum (strain ATCC 18683 / 1980 / Ss-1) TaxID=665079 RepID=A7EBQ0_SCLS1|nr:predicted protein [Sclerotinia sclerotiorum 1980 UF-70]EDN99878.1 predicted protein [Sclerotinia sclerotiorum 1980 UF-70]